MNLNSPPSHFPMHQMISHDNDHELHFHRPFVPNRLSSLSCNLFFDLTQDCNIFYDHRQLYQPIHHIKGEGYGYCHDPSCETKSKVGSGLKLSLWEKEEHELLQSNNRAIKWMSSKKTSNGGDRVSLKTNDQKLQQPSSSDFSSNSSSYNNNSPIRVCSDCNTTKTPLWRSGPKGPKSLCNVIDRGFRCRAISHHNACGIRQRKARRAMAEAANGAAAHGGEQIPVTKIKLQQKVKTGKNGQLKKSCKMAAASTTVEAESPSEGKKKIGFEEFLINLSKNLAFHRVFPDDEKDAALLLMALSSGLVNG